MGNRGNCSIEAYESALKRGCRCVECMFFSENFPRFMYLYLQCSVDCWDQGDSVVVTHGGAFTGSIKFKDAIHTINEFAFSSTPYVNAMLKKRPRNYFVPSC